MPLLLPLGRSVRRIHTTAVASYWRQPGMWFDDYKARKWPETPEQRKAAAIKYGIREEDYIPEKVDAYGYGIGDYPYLGDLGYVVKDPYENWSLMMYRRNFGEPVPHDYMCLAPDKTSYTKTEYFTSRWEIIRKFVFIFGSMLAAIYGCLTFPVTQIVPMKPKQYPYDYSYALPASNPKLYPLTNYTFEPADSTEEH